jgi:hypothetical protein
LDPDKNAKTPLNRKYCDDHRFIESVVMWGSECKPRQANASERRKQLLNNNLLPQRTTILKTCK